MKYATNKNANRIEVEYSGQRVTCPNCGGEVFGRCPAVAVAHCPIFLDMGSIGFVHVWSFTTASGSRGTGELMTRENFVERSKSDWIKNAASPKEKEETTKEKVKRKLGTAKRQWGDSEGRLCLEPQKTVQPAKQVVSKLRKGAKPKTFSVVPEPIRKDDSPSDPIVLSDGCEHKLIEKPDPNRARGLVTTCAKCSRFIGPAQ